MFSESAKRFVGGVFAIGFLVIFLACYIYLIVISAFQSYFSEASTFDYMAGVSAGLIGTIVAMAMGVTPPKSDMSFMKRILAAEWNAFQQLIAVLYAIAYTGIGIASIAVLLIDQSAHPLISSFGPTFIGFGLALARGFFGISTQQQSATAPTQTNLPL